MSLLQGAVLAPGEAERIQKAVDTLAGDNHAPREISVKVVLHVHHEYPKHIKVGEKTVSIHNPRTGETENQVVPVVKIVNDAEEEAALSAGE